jgi:ATP-dependent DNA helicase PIF1
MSYKSIDTVCDATEVVNYLTVFLNSLDLSGKPLHNLQLKIGTPVILIRNLNPPRLYNDTQLVIKILMKNVIEAIILNGKFRGENILLPRIPIIPTDVPIQFKRLQFPFRLAFAITINKSQGQTMSVCGLDLSNIMFFTWTIIHNMLSNHPVFIVFLLILSLLAIYIILKDKF